MRYYLFILLLAFAPITQAQITAKPLAITDTAYNDYFNHHKAPVIHIKLLNATKIDTTGLIVTYTTVTPFAQLQSSKLAHINKDNSFNLPMDYPFPNQEVWVGVGTYFYSGVYVNKDLTIEINFLPFHPQKRAFKGEMVKYKGDDADLNKWMAKALEFKRQRGWYDIDSKKFTLKFDDTYYTKLDSLNSLKKSLENDFLSKNSSSYAWILENERMSDYYTSVLLYCTIKRVSPPMWNELKAHKALLISNSGMDFNEKLYQYFSYVRMETNYNHYSLKSETDRLDSAFGRPWADVLKFHISQKDVRIDERVLKQLAAEVTTPWCKTALQKQHQEAEKQLKYVNESFNNAKKNTADTLFSKEVTELDFGAKLTVVNRMTASEFLAKLKNVSKGKAILLDFWATWCGPCIGDMPYSHKLHDAAANLPVEFVYICTAKGSSEEKWRNKVAELKQPGMHFFVDEVLGTELMQTFQKSGYPSYVCINQVGEVQPQLISFMSQVNIDDLKKLVNKN